MEVDIGPVSPILSGSLRADILCRGMVIECKEFSGQQGTIWKKIVADLLSYSRCRGRVIFVLGNRCPSSVFEALLKSRDLVAPSVEVMKEDDFYVEASEWAPE